MLRCVAMYTCLRIESSGHRIDEGSQSLRIADRPVRTNGANHAGERFLAEFVDNVGRKAAGAELQLEKLREIANKMILRRRVPFPEALKIGLVEIEKFQKRPRSAGKYSRDGTAVAMERGVLKDEQEKTPRMKRIRALRHYWV